MSLNIKCVVVGDGTVGKTCLLMSYVKNQFPIDHIPTIFETHIANAVVGSQSVSLLLFDTAGQEDYDRLRILSYPGTDVFLLCFSVDSPSSLQNIEERWLPELRTNGGPEVPIVLVATKVDLRNSETVAKKLQRRNETTVSEEEGLKMAQKINAYCYLECSALTQRGLKEVFDEAILSVIQPKKKRKPVGCFPWCSSSSR